MLVSVPDCQRCVGMGVCFWECYGSVPVCMGMPAVLVENIGAECDHGSVFVSVECRASLFYW